MASTEPIPRQGEIWLTAFGAARVGEPGKNRPAVVLSVGESLHGSVYDLVIVAPFSATMTPADVRPLVRGTPASGLGADSVVVVRALRGVAASRLLKRVGVIDNDTLERIQEIIAVLLGMP